MWIYDLTAALVCCVVVAFGCTVAYRIWYDQMHPSPTLEEEIKYYEDLNDDLRNQLGG